MKIIIASHGDYSKGVLSSLNVIFGDTLPYEVETYSLYTGDNVNDLANNIIKSINMDEQTLILTDLYGGSVDNSLIPLLEKENVKVISGINMAFVLEIMTLSDTSNLSETIDRIIDNAREGLVSKNKMYKQLQIENQIDDDLE